MTHRRQEIRERLCAALRQHHDLDATITPEGELVVQGAMLEYDWRDEYQRERSGYLSKRTERVRVCIADEQGRYRSYPERADGSLNYEAMAERLANTCRFKQARQEMAARREANRAGVEALAEDLGLTRHSRPMAVRPSNDPARPVLAEVHIRRVMTYSEAKQLREALEALGYLG